MRAGFLGIMGLLFLGCFDTGTESGSCARVCGEPEPTDTLTTLAQVRAFDSVRVIRGSLVISLGDADTSLVGFGRLDSITGGLKIADCMGMRTLNAFPRLKFVGKGIEIYHNPVLGYLDFPGPDLATPSERVIANPALRSLRLVDSTGTRRDIEVSSNDSLSGLSFDMDEDTLGSVDIEANPRLAAMTGQLRSERIADLTLWGNPALTEITCFRGIRTLGALLVAVSPDVHMLPFESLETCASVQLWNIGGGARFSFPKLARADTLGLFLWHDVAQVEAFPALQGGIKRLDIKETSLENIDFLSRCRFPQADVSIEGNGRLASASPLAGGAFHNLSLWLDTNLDHGVAEGLEEVRGDLKLSEDPARPFTHLKLRSVGGSLTLYRFQSLDAFPDLERVAGALNLWYYRGAGIRGFEKVDTLEGVMLEGGAFTSTEGFLPNLRGIGVRGLSLFQVDSLADFALFPRLRECAGNIYVQECGSLLRITGSPALRTLGQDWAKALNPAGTLGILRCPRLERIGGFDSLERAGKVQIVGNPALLGVSGFPSLDSLLGLEITDNTALDTVRGFNRLGRVIGSFTLSGNPRLSGLDAFASLRSVGDLDLSGNGAICGSALVAHAKSKDLNPSLKVLGACQ